MVKSIMTPSKLGRTAMFIDLEKPAPPKLFSAALLAEAEAKGKVMAASAAPTTSVEELKEEKEEEEAKSKASEEIMSALRINPVPKVEIVDAFAD